MKTQEELALIYREELQYIDDLFSDESLPMIKPNNNTMLKQIDLAWRAIARYQWIDYNEDTLKEDKRGYEQLIAELAIAYYNNSKFSYGALRGEKAVTQMSQGSRSVTYKSNISELDANGLTTAVKAALPPRKLRVM